MMDAYTVYLNTFRYVMNADPSVKSSWCDIFKYLPTLHRMLSCSVCGNILRNPFGAANSSANGVCLHHVCYKCLGGKVMLKSSCNWCKDHSCFKENKKLRVLILCFKRLCAYISHSRLGSAIHSASLNGHDSNAVENTQTTLKDAEQFVDDYELTPPPFEPLGIVKQRVQEHKYSLTEYKPSASTSGFVRKQNNFLTPQNIFSSSENKTSGKQKQRGRRKKNLNNIAIKSSPKTNASIHVKMLKRKALNTSRRKDAASKSTLNDISRNSPAHKRKRVSISSTGLLISQRPHRQLSGKFSVGQLWRETFLEERSPEPEVYPDSGIEVGNSSDQDHGSQSPTSATQQVNDVISPTTTTDASNSNSEESIIEKIVYPIRDTRLHPRPIASESQQVTLASANANNIAITERKHSNSITSKPKLTLKIPKKSFKNLSKKRGGPLLNKVIEEEVISQVSTSTTKLIADPVLEINRMGSSTGVHTRIKDSLKQRKDICRCARFKRPNQLTCFGQKCPCYRDKKPCVNCMCNGCKNPRRHSSDSAPPLMHVTKTTKDSHCLSPDMDLSMPRLSPIPRM